MSYLAVDPGKTTGLAYLDDEARLWQHEGDFNGALGWVEDRIRGCRTLIIESYIIMPRAVNAPWSLEMIGALRRMTFVYSVPVVMQRPADAKRFADNPRLRRLGWYSTKDHSRDATRHLVKYLADHHPELLPPEDH